MLESLNSWWQDRLLRGIVKNSAYLFSSNSAAILLSTLQSILAARLLGVEQFGILAGAVIPFASNVNRLLSFRMSEVIVKSGGEYLASGQKERASAVIKGAALVETVTSTIAYLLLLLLAPLAGRYLAKDPQAAPLFAIYGLFLLTNFAAETATGVLQITNNFNRLAWINFVHSLITAAFVFLAFVLKQGIWAVLAGYLAGKAFAGLAMALLAFRKLNGLLGRGWWRVPLNLVPDWRILLRFALSTNLQGTINLLVRDSETLLVTALRSPLEAGYFKIALGVINLVMLPIEPFIAPTYAEIARTVSQRDWSLTSRILRRVTAISGAWTIIAGTGLALFGYWLIPLMYGLEYRPAYPALLLLLIGYGYANIFHWNRPLLLALGRPIYPLKVSFLTGLVKTGLTFALVPAWGFVAEAGVLSFYFIVSVSAIVRRGWRLLSQSA